jgi:hypothetical protein
MVRLNHRILVEFSASLGFGKNKSSWSYLELYSDYEKFQIKIREKIKELYYNSPLELEMDILWKK